MRKSGCHPNHPAATTAIRTKAAPSPVICVAVLDSFSNQAVATRGARPSSKAGSTIEKIKANRSFGRLISASRLPAMASKDRCFGLETSSSTSPRRGSTSGGSTLCAIVPCRAARTEPDSVESVCVLDSCAVACPFRKTGGHPGSSPGHAFPGTCSTVSLPAAIPARICGARRRGCRR
jgi:hypothetical protein